MEPTRYDMIQALKKRFPLNNPASWARHSTKQLRAWCEEYGLFQEFPDALQPEPVDEPLAHAAGVTLMLDDAIVEQVASDLLRAAALIAEADPQLAGRLQDWAQTVQGLEDTGFDAHLFQEGQP